MRNLLKSVFLVVLFFSVFATPSLAAKSFNVGVSPGTINLGDLEAGSTEAVDFYITTPSDEAIMVKLEPEIGSLEFFNKPDYRSLVQNCSEEDSSSWVRVINNPVEIKPSNETLKTTGGLIRGKEQISFLIEIPKEAEPGYHVFYIKPVPFTPSEEIGSVGSRVVAVTSISVLLSVNGNAVRRGTILDTETGNYVGNRLEIKTYFQNTGTVTITAKASQKIYDKDGGFVGEIFSGREYVKPKEIKTFVSLLPTEGLSLEKYNIYSIVDYTTGKAEKSLAMELTSAAPATLAVKYGLDGIGAILIVSLIIIILVSVIIYRRLR